jgi:Tol biopolymer transport system component
MRARTRSVAAALASITLAALLLAPHASAIGAGGRNGLIAFASTRSGTSQVYAMRSDGSDPIQLTSLGTNLDPEFNADGSKIVFVSTRDGQNEVYTMDANGANQVRLTTNTIDEYHPQWAPNGTLIDFQGVIGTDSDIYQLTLKNGLVTDLTPNTPDFWDADFAWSAGGIPVAFDSTGRSGPGLTDIFSMNNDGSNLKQLTTTGVSSHPAWSPDNKSIAFQSAPPPHQSFTALSAPVGLAFAGATLLVTQQRKDKITAVAANGTQTTFATLPSTNNAKLERYIAVSPGLGGYPAGDVYVSVRRDILQITPDGLTVTTFATIPDLPNSNNFLLFDQVGTFGYQLIVIGGQSGKIFTCDSTGVCTLLINLHSITQELEGADIAPLTWAPYGGELLAASKYDNTVYAIKNDGTWNAIPNSPDPEGVQFVPPTVCTYGTSSGAYFIAMDSANKIEELSASLFVGVVDAALVPAEIDTTINELTTDGTTVTSSLFIGPLGTPGEDALEQGVFAPCAEGSAGTRTGSTDGSAPNGMRSTQSVTPSEIYTMRADGTLQTRLTNNSFDDSRPAWSPSGTQLVYQSDRNDPAWPDCESTGTCNYQLYEIPSTGGTETDISNDATVSDTAGDWETVSTIANVSDFVFDPGIAKPKLGGTELWLFNGPSQHTATDTSFGGTLFDSGIKDAGTYYAFNFIGAGKYPYECTLHPSLMTGTVSVPMSVVPGSGTTTTTFTVTWGSTLAPSPYVFDVQIQRPGTSGFVDWKVSQTAKSASFVPDGGPGTYSFQARFRNILTGQASNYSAIKSIIVS